MPTGRSASNGPPREQPTRSGPTATTKPSARPAAGWRVANPTPDEALNWKHMMAGVVITKLCSRAFGHSICHLYKKAMFNPFYPGDLVRESLDGLCAATGQLLPDVAERLEATLSTLAAICDQHQPITSALAPRIAVP
jgi:hypothetical protein